MGIVDEDIEKVREATDFIAILSQYTQVRKQGVNWTALCPFHGEKTPSFSVNPTKGVYYCFGCQAHGDVITFVREIEHTDFAGAVEFLAAKAGITLRYTDKFEGENRRERQRLVGLMEQAVEWYHQRLLTAPDAGAARRYLRERGFSADEVRHYRLGWAPEGWDELAKVLKLGPKDGEATGLGRLNARNRMQDFFRARLLFPIFDAQGDPVSFGGRKLPGAEGPKYRNTAESRLYQKSKVLYGLNWAKDDAVRADEAIVCEGYTDVIGFAAVGVGRAVAPCGTALTDEHVKLLRRYARRVVLAFDPDAAGQAAAERFYEWERRYEMDVAVADLPPGMDPGDLARSDPERLRAAVSGAKPFLGFRVGRVLSGANLESPEGRAKAAELALAVVAEHPSEFVRDQYVMEIADRCRLDPERLRATVAEAQRTGQRAAVVASTPGAGADGSRGRSGGREGERDTAETEALRLAVHRPAEMLPRLAEVLFDDEVHREAYQALAAAGGDLHRALGSVDPDVAELLERLAVTDTGADPDDVRRLLLREKGMRALADLQQEARQVPERALEWAPSISWLKLQMEGLSPDGPPQPEVEDQLVGWLMSRAEGAS